MKQKDIEAAKQLADFSAEVTPTYPFRSNRNAKHLPKQYEHNSDPSKTIPDQTMSIKEILTRYAKGLPLEGARVPIYNGEEEIPDTRKMDLSEIEELKRQNREEIKRMQQELQNPKPRKKPEPKPQDEPKGAAPSAGASGEAEA